MKFNKKMSELSTSRIRRKVRSRLSRLGDKISSDFSVSFQDISQSENTLARNFKKFVHRASTTDIDSCGDSDYPQRVNGGNGPDIVLRRDGSSSDEDSDTMKVVILPVGHKGRLERSCTEVDETDENEHGGSDGNLFEKFSQRLKERSGKVQKVNIF